MRIDRLRRSIRADKYEISLHAQKERFQEDIKIRDIEQVILRGEVIEDYPDDPRGPSCLVLGFSRRRPIHVLCGILPGGWIRIITVYIPKTPKWISPEQRSR